MLHALLTAALAVVSVADGDALTLREGDLRIIVRPAEIDAPERVQPYSQVSRRNRQAICGASRDVRFDYVGNDRYGRTVAHVWCDGAHVN